MQKNKNTYSWLSLVELIVATSISVIVLWWVMFFVSLALEEIGQNNQKNNYMNSFYELSTFLNTADVDIISIWWFDTWIVSWVDWEGGILIGVVHADTFELIQSSDIWTYLPMHIVIRELSEQELDTIQANPNNIQNIVFYPDQTLQEFYVHDFSIQDFWAWEITTPNIENIYELQVSILTNFNFSLKWTDISDVDITDVSTYTFYY